MLPTMRRAEIEGDHLVRDHEQRLPLPLHLVRDWLEPIDQVLYSYGGWGSLRAAPEPLTTV